MIVRILTLVLALGGVAAKAVSAEIIAPGDQWRYLKGRTEASNPVDSWRQTGFDDSAWQTGPTPFFYGEALSGTLLNDMRGEYSSVFMRKTFVISNPAGVEDLELETLSDDGFIAWLNGVEIARYNMPGGNMAFNRSSLGALSEPIPWETTLIEDAGRLLVAGTNVLAVHGFNSSLGSSSDFVFDALVRSFSDIVPPSIVTTIPASGALVRFLTSIEVIFSEPVTGVEAGDLLVNGVPAAELEIPSPNQFLFQFAEPATGIVQVAWAEGHGIRDLSPGENRFIGSSWTYEFDPNAPEPSILISEFLAANDRVLNDENGDSSDWIELFNPTDQAVDISGWFLSDNPNNPSRWRFPAASIDARSYLVVFASGKDRRIAGRQLHTSFTLPREGGFLLLSNPGTNVVSSYEPYPEQFQDVSYGRDRSNPNILGYFPGPTPGAPNTPGGAGFAPEVQFSMPGKTFQGWFNLELSCAASNAVIRYVIGKTNLPDANSPVYTGPLRITQTTQIRARAFVDGLLPGNPRSESYLLMEGPIVNFTSDLPVVVLHNYGSGSVPASGEQFVMMQIYEPRNGVTSLTNPPAFSERARFRLRGSSTQGYPKGSFAVETWDEFGDDKKVSVLGMPNESDWVFYAPNNFEPALIHNPFMHRLSREIGRYSPRTRFAEVFLKTSGGAMQQGDYNGIYVIEEKIKRDPNRVDIDKLQPEHLDAPEVTGGYLLKIDRPDPGEPNFSAAGQDSLAFVDPKWEVIRTAARDPQEQYIRNYLNQFGAALNGSNFRNPTNGYAAYLDVPAAIDHHILNVFAFNVDALRLSTYLHKPRNGKLTFGPLWDFDRALGSTDGRDSNPRAWYGPGGTEFFTYPWWGRMFQDIDFWQQWTDRWEEFRRTHLSTANVERLIDELSGEVRTAQPREFQRWRVAPRGGSYATEISRMKEYLRLRSEWIDAQLVRPPELNRSGGMIEPGTAIELSATNTIYYTLDGTDPRLPGGGILTGARTYTGPITLTNNARLFARAYRPGHTGGPTSSARTPWSGALVETFMAREPRIVVSEIMYHPAGLPNAPFEKDDYEFIELRNDGAGAVNLAGFAFTNGIDFRFTSGVLQPGEHIVVVKHRAAFEARYGTDPRVAGEYGGSLSNSGERLVLIGPVQEVVADFEYSDRWHRVTDGSGFSLVRDDAGVEPSGWRPSARLHGSPGIADPERSAFPLVVVSEVFSRTDPPQTDFVEIANLSGTPVDVSGWYLTDDLDEPKKYRIGQGQLPAGEHRHFTDSQLGFAFSADGEDAYLFSADATGELTGYAHGFSFGRSEHGISFVRAVTSDGHEHFVQAASATPGAPNAAPKVGEVLVTEVMFQPLPVGGNNNTIDEYIEIRNRSSRTVHLFDPQHPTNTWQLRDAVTFDLPAGISLAPAELIVFAGFDPRVEPGTAAAFRARFNVPEEVRILGPWQGVLNNAGERIVLLKPDGPGTGVPVTVPYVVVDEFSYRPEGTHPAAGARGTGQSIHRLDNTWGEEPTAWRLGDPTPGFYAAPPFDADNDGLPDAWEIANGLDPSDPSGVNGPDGDPDGDGATNLEEYLAGTDPQDPESVLRIAAEFQDGRMVILFLAAEGRGYAIEWRNSLMADEWTQVADVPPGAARVVELEFTEPLETGFYRLVIPAD